MLNYIRQVRGSHCMRPRRWHACGVLSPDAGGRPHRWWTPTHVVVVSPAAVVDPGLADKIRAQHHQRLVQQPLGLEVWSSALIARSRTAAFRVVPSKLSMWVSSHSFQY